MHKAISSYRKNSGFTLVELIVVIVILGILSVIAAPRFISLRQDAIIASIQGVEAAVESGTSLIFARAVIQNQINDSGSVELEEGVFIPTHSGYPIAVWQTSLSFSIGLENIVFLDANTECESDWCARGNQSSANTDDSLTISGSIAKIFPRGFTFEDLCGVHYVNNEDGTQPIIGISTSEC